MGLLVFFVIAGCVTISSAVSCYDCTEKVYFNRKTGLFNITPCMAPLSSTNEPVKRKKKCSGKCGTRLSLSEFTPDQFLSIVRSCVQDDALMDESMSASSSMDDAPREKYVYSSQCNNCTDPYDCTLCCDSKNCNSAAVADIIQDNQIGQSCYDCLPGDIGCGLNFDPKGTGVNYTFCDDLCYTAVTMIEVEEVQRGCMFDTSICDRANQTDQEAIKIVRHGDLDYEIKCCLGSVCNRAQSIGATCTTSIVLTMLASYVAFLALAT